MPLSIEGNAKIQSLFFPPNELQFYFFILNHKNKLNLIFRFEAEYKDTIFILFWQERLQFLIKKFNPPLSSRTLPFRSGRKYRSHF